MSKKKAKTRVDKEVKKHNFSHLEKTYSIKTEKTTDSVAKTKSDLSPQNTFIKKDLKQTVITISAFVIVIVALSYITYRTNLLTPTLSYFGLRY